MKKGKWRKKNRGQQRRGNTSGRVRSRRDRRETKSWEERDEQTIVQVIIKWTDCSLLYIKPSEDSWVVLLQDLRLSVNIVTADWRDKSKYSNVYCLGCYTSEIKSSNIVLNRWHSKEIVEAGNKEVTSTNTLLYTLNLQLLIT